MNYYPIHMHLHCAHEASASIGSHMSHAKALGIEYLWLTEHDSRIGKSKGRHFAFSFPEPKLWVHLPDIDRDAGFQEKEQNTGSYAFAEDETGISLQLSAKKGQRECLFFHSQAKRHSDPLTAGVTVEMDADMEVGEDGFACVEFILSAQPLHNQQVRLCYILGQAPEAERWVQYLPFPRKKDGKYRFSLSEDVSAEIGGLDNALCNLNLIAENGAEIRLRSLGFYRELEYQNARQAQIVLAEKLGKKWGVKAFVGFEISKAGNHKNCFSTSVPLIEYDKFDAVSNLQAVAHLQKYNAVYSWNHPFSEHGCKGQTKEEIFEEKAQELINARVFGAHLMEVGFPYTRGGFELEYYLRLWDRLSENGILITGEGDSDNHHATENGWTEGNNFCSFAGLYDDELPTEENFAKAFKRGTLWGGNPVVMRNLSFTGNGKEQGSLLRGEQAEIDFCATDIQCGGYAVCMENGREIARFPIENGAVSGNWTLKCTQKYNFARVELYSEENVLIAFSNPIYLVASETEIEER